MEPPWPYSYLLKVTKVLVNFLQRPMVFSNLFGVSVRNLSEEKMYIKDE